eukprot:TRINITY_DN1697_c2_g1_i2.p1 TRINITY_DN1697_c2_g1~~TRINITY_DN1697_c2_g1_i2.p1  ORF type:complete len:541 (-),score=142.45 TRINITY_DN1697_c2_g1_i2:31-1653(-)
MRPDEGYLDQLVRKEEGLLASIYGELTQAQVSTIRSEAENLAQDQEKEIDFECLPSLRVADIPVEGDLDQEFNFQVINLKGKEVQVANHVTNGIVYFKALVNSQALRESLTPEERALLPFFVNTLTEVGAGKRSHIEMAEIIEATTGGFGATLSCNAKPSDVEALPDEHLILSGHALSRNTNNLVELSHDLLFEPKFSLDPDHIETLLLGYSAGIANSLQDSGHSFALSHAAALTGAPVSLRSEEMGGLAYAKFIGDLASPDSVKKLDWVISTLEGISNKLSIVGVDRFAVTADENTWANAQGLVESSKILGRFAASSQTEQRSILIQNPTADKPVYVALPIQVNHAATAFQTVPFVHDDAPKLRVLGSLISTFYLHKEIREKGGAYGAGASNSFNGIFSFYSFRDPNCQRTLDVFRECSKWASGKSSTTPLFTEQNVNEALLKLFSSLDSPTGPSQKGMGYFTSRISKEMALRNRQRLLSVTRDQLVDVAERYLVKAFESGSTKAVVVGRADGDSLPSPEQWTIKTMNDGSFQLPGLKK